MKSSQSSNRSISLVGRKPQHQPQQRNRVYLRIPATKNNQQSGLMFHLSTYGATTDENGGDDGNKQEDNEIEEGLLDAVPIKKTLNNEVPCCAKFLYSLGCEDAEVSCRVTMFFLNLLVYLAAPTILRIIAYLTNPSGQHISWFSTLLPFILICLVVVVPALIVGNASRDRAKPTITQHDANAKTVIIDDDPPSERRMIFCCCFERSLKVSFFLVLGALLTVLASMLDNWMDQQMARVILIVLGSVGSFLLICVLVWCLCAFGEERQNRRAGEKTQQGSPGYCVGMTNNCCRTPENARSIYISSLIGLLLTFVALPVLKANPWMPIFREDSWGMILMPLSIIFIAISTGIFPSFCISMFNNDVHETIREAKCFMALLAVSLFFFLSGLGSILEDV
jgi:hypothetical protein